jgi:hypothetical protein
MNFNTGPLAELRFDLAFLNSEMKACEELNNPDIRQVIIILPG